MEEGMSNSATTQNQPQTFGKLLRQAKDILAQCNKLIFSHCLPATATLVTGTIVCPLNGNKIKLCFQENRKAIPFILVELPVSTARFSNLIQCGVVRIVMEPVVDPPTSNTWAMHCNGHKVGFASRIGVGEEQCLLGMLTMVSAGGGILMHKATEAGGYKYLRGQFERVIASDNSESYHLKDPSHSFGQELSLFFLSSK